MNLEMLELVLTELLEEQKKETITNGEMVSIVKRALEKLEAMEQLIQPSDGPGILERIRAIQIACQHSTEKPATASPPTMQVQTIIKHHFYFKTTAVIASVFFIIIVVLTCLYLGKRKEAYNRRANDIKYRYLKLNASPGVEKVLRLTDSLYLFALDSMQEKVEWVEKQQRDNPANQPGKRPSLETDKKRLSK